MIRFVAGVAVGVSAVLGGFVALGLYLAEMQQRVEDERWPL